MKPSLTLVLAWISLAPWSLAAEPHALFNGRDLAGWTFDFGEAEVDPASVFSVRDGILICGGSPNGVIRTEQDYGDYELRIEWRWPEGSEPGNSGVLIHCTEPRHLGVWPKCLEVQLQGGNAGDFWMLGETITVEGAEAQGRRWQRQVENEVEKPAGEWNEMKIRSIGDSVTVWVNGSQVNHGTGGSRSTGAIAFQSEGTEVHFRVIELTPLAAAAEDSAPAQD